MPKIETKQTEAPKTFTNRAIGTRFNAATNQYELVVLAYNPESKEAEVAEVKVTSSYQRDIQDAFKRVAMELNFV